MLAEWTSRMQGGRGLTPAEVEEAVGWLTREDVDAAAKAAFLTALANKGETVEEIASFAQACRGLSLTPVMAPGVRSGDILDVVGTGGDRLNTFNISTTAALVVAGAGVVVAKHGNRAATSKAGSADVLEALGVKTVLAPGEAGEWLGRHGFAFFFAPAYHPAFKHVVGARKLCAERGQRTIFNYLGPLLNPARPTCQLMGVPRPEMCEPLARVLQSLGVRRAMVVCGEVGVGTEGGGVRACLDEFSTLGKTTIAEYYQDRALNVSEFEPGSLPLQAGRLEDLVGGDREQNAEIVRQLVSGRDRGPRRDALLLNAGAALFVAGRVRSIGEGWELAADVIDRGVVREKLAALVAASRES